jgi:hypothetical protein
MNRQYHCVSLTWSSHTRWLPYWYTIAPTTGVRGFCVGWLRVSASFHERLPQRCECGECG